MLYTGIDLHKSFSYLTTIDENGKVFKEEKIYNDPVRILNYFWSMNDVHKAVVECTLGWYWLSDLLHDNHIELILAHSKMLKAFAAAKVKTDKVDSFVMAQLLRAGFIPLSYQIPPELRQKRDLMRARLKLIQRKVSLINSVHRILEKFNLTDPDDLPGLYQLQFQQLDKQITLCEHLVKVIPLKVKRNFQRACVMTKKYSLKSSKNIRDLGIRTGKSWYLDLVLGE